MATDQHLSPHFTASEIGCRCGCGTLIYAQPLLDGLEALRARVGKPIHVNCAYRCPAHNQAVGGAPHSLHLRGEAADICVPSMTARQLYVAAQSIPQFHGFGVSDHAQYLHVDVRAVPARWCYDEAGREIPWYEGA
jgi:zinc D-Ala-D-Ala carboxypeptidase